MPKTLCVDFDGVIHMYTSKWTHSTEVLDGPVPGAFAWLEQMLAEGFDVQIYSSRSKDPGGIDAMREWFADHGFARTNALKFPTQKPAAWLTIDDRAICFRGEFPTAKEINAFRPWNK